MYLEGWKLRRLLVNAVGNLLYAFGMIIYNYKLMLYAPMQYMSERNERKKQLKLVLFPNILINSWPNIQQITIC